MSNPTSNFGWQMPTATDLVTDLPADFEVFGQAVDTTLVDLKGGTSGQILAKNTNTDMDFVWTTPNPGDITAVTAGTGITGGGTSGAVTITNDMATTITAAGDIVVGTGSGTYDNLPIGTTAQVLTADTTVSPYKVKWATPAATSPTFVGCSIYQAGAGQTPANATDTLLTFDAEFFDSNGFHSTSTNTGRVTIPTGYAGKYLVNYAVRAVANSTGYRTLTIYKNGSSYVQFMDEVANGSVTSYPARSIILNLAEGDYLTFYYYQNSGGALTIYVREYEMPVQVSWLGA